MIYTIKNDKIEVSVEDLGAQMRSIRMQKARNTCGREMKNIGTVLLRICFLILHV